MSEPTLKDCINYMRSQIKQMEKYPRNFEYNLPYYRKTVEILEKLTCLECDGFGYSDTCDHMKGGDEK